MSKAVPEGWAIRTLSDLASIDNKSLKNNTDPDYRFRYIDIASVKTAKVDIPAEYVSFGESPSRARKCVRKGDVLMSTVRPNLKGFAYFDVQGDDFVASTGFSVITASKMSDSNFLYQSILSDNVTRQIESLVAGSNYPAISSANVKSLEVLAPPLPEQQKIATILSSVDDVIEKTRAQIDKLKDLKTGMMQELLTQGIGHTEFKDSPVGRIPADWKVVELGDICNVQGGYAFKSTDAADSGCRWLKIANVGKGKAVWNDKSFLPNTFMLEHKNFMLEDGDIVLALTRPVISGELKVARMTLSDVPALLNQRVARAMPNPQRVSSDYLFALFSWAKLANDIETEIFGTDPPNVSTKQIESFRYAIPPRNEQQLIANSIFSISNRIDLACKKLAQLLNTKKALMQDLLTGKVRVKLTDLDTETAS